MDITVERILELCQTRGVTLEFLNDLIGGYYGKTKAWKSGRVQPTFTELQIIANYFHVSLEFLLGHSFIAEPQAPMPTEPLAIIAAAAEEEDPSGGSYLYIATPGRSDGRTIRIPADKVERVLMLIEAAFPEILK